MQSNKNYTGSLVASSASVDGDTTSIEPVFNLSKYRRYRVRIMIREGLPYETIASLTGLSITQINKCK